VPDEPGAAASSPYALGQLERAIERLVAAPDPQTQARAKAKMTGWRSVLDGITDGSLTVGSRTPVAGTPAWVTLEVTHGGFATGRLLAATPPGTEERSLLRVLPGDLPGQTDRERVNLWYLGDAGQQDLLQALPGGRYRVEVPEEAALPVVAWLLDHEQFEAALDLVSELRPWMDRLRFTPRPAAAPPPPGTVVHVATAGAIAAIMKDAPPRTQITVMRETLAVWNPLFDRLVALWCDTVDGDLPRLAGKPVTGKPGGLTVTGDWPCRRWPAGWPARRRTWLADFREAMLSHQLAARHRSPKSNFQRLRNALEKSGDDGSWLTGRDVGWIRRALANTITRHGAPGSPPRAALRAVQAEVARRPAYADLAQVVAGRLSQYPADGGIPDLAAIAADVGAGESAQVPAGEPIPAHLARKAARALDAPVHELVAQGIISSGEVLATVLPQITAQVLAAGIGDPDLGALCGQAYAAFRRRRSLLLLNLEHQVQFTELPWIAALQPYRASDATAASAARQALTDATFLALTGFPQAIVPNGLVREMSTLATEAGLSLPLVEEVAADIFTGTFTSKWQHAAAAASRSLDGTLYARYYDLPHPATWASSARSAPKITRRRRGATTADEFGALCAARSAEAHTEPQGSHVAANGAILEQSQILTTHNLAVLIDALDLRDRITTAAPCLADRDFAWLVRQLSQQPPSWRARLHAVKNAAYAWRNAIYFLSLCDQPTQAEALARLRGHLHTAGNDLQARFGPAIDGLAHVLAGGHFDAAGIAAAPGAGRRFLGWSVGPHWILSPARVQSPD
jgi:hypothetical protein